MQLICNANRPAIGFRVQFNFALSIHHTRSPHHQIFEMLLIKARVVACVMQYS
jgi:hypothetical protein